jgi:hypothetical protein
MRTALSAVAQVYASDRAFYTGILIAWEMLGILVNVAVHAGYVPVVLAG